MTSASKVDLTVDGNTERRCPVVLLLDTSYSMDGDRMAEMNAGLQAFAETLAADGIAKRRVEAAIVTFGETVQTWDPRSGDSPTAATGADAFCTADEFRAPTLRADGSTPMGEAVNTGLRLIRERKELYKQSDLDYYRPWMFLITDGAPTDVWQSAADAARREEQRGGVIMFTVGVAGADMETLKQFSARPLSC